jgi:hypothetical protein
MSAITGPAVTSDGEIDKECDPVKDKNCKKDSNPPVNEKEAPIPPKGDCVLIYSECFFNGHWESVCTAEPRIYSKAKSIYVPKA